jgi:hypothetical protein
MALCSCRICYSVNVSRGTDFIRIDITVFQQNVLGTPDFQTYWFIITSILHNSVNEFPLHPVNRFTAFVWKPYMGGIHWKLEGNEVFQQYWYERKSNLYGAITGPFRTSHPSGDMVKWSVCYVRWPNGAPVSNNNHQVSAIMPTAMRWEESYCNVYS